MFCDFELWSENASGTCQFIGEEVGIIQHEPQVDLTVRMLLSQRSVTPPNLAGDVIAAESQAIHHSESLDGVAVDIEGLGFCRPKGGPCVDQEATAVNDALIYDEAALVARGKACIAIAFYLRD